MINFINISAMTNNLRSENLMTQKLSEAETKCQNKTKKILYQYLYLLFVYHKKKSTSVSQDSILEMKNPVPIAKLA